MYYHIILDDPNLFTGVGNKIKIYKTVNSTQELFETLQEFWYHYQNDELTNPKEFDDASKHIEDYFKSFNKTNLKNENKTIYLENFCKNILNHEYHNKLLNLSNFTKEENCCQVFVLASDNENISMTEKYLNIISKKYLRSKL